MRCERCGNRDRSLRVDPGMGEPSGPNPFAVLWSMLRALRVRRPAPRGTDAVSHEELSHVLHRLGKGGVPALAEERPLIASYRARLEAIDPDRLTRDGALAYWLNLYNAGAIDLAAATFAAGGVSVLRIPGGFTRPWASVAGEELSLDGIEHGKIRRFGDPRIHGALVCGSASCPTLRYEPYTAEHLDDQLDDQLRSFLSAGGAIADRSTSTLRLSRIFLWYGADFVRPDRMPTLVPARKTSIAHAVRPWLESATQAWVAASQPAIAFQPYDWSLACAVGPTSRRASQPDEH